MEPFMLANNPRRASLMKFIEDDCRDSVISKIEKDRCQH